MSVWIISAGRQTFRANIRADEVYSFIKKGRDSSRIAAFLRLFVRRHGRFIEITPADRIGIFADFAAPAAAHAEIDFRKAKAKIDIKLYVPQAVLAGRLIHTVTSECHCEIYYTLNVV